MQALDLDFFEMLNSCIGPSDVEVAWQKWMTKLGYGRSGIFTFSWEGGRVAVPRHASNWETQVLDDYFKENYYRFDPAGNPLIKSSSFLANHIGKFSLKGKPGSISTFVDFVNSVCLPGEVCVPIVVAPNLRLGFNGWVEATERELEMLAQETQDTIKLAANAGAARIMQLSNGIIYPNENPLSQREQECLLWLSRGDRIADIANRLGVNTKTIDFHLSGAREKLNAKTSTEAVVLAVVNHYIRP